jgi:hypothetical protein
MVNFGNGSDPREYLAKAVSDRVATTATVWLGTTLACAQCHDHKYDPFTHREFYQLYAFFNNVPEKGLDGERRSPVPTLLTPTPEQARRLAAVRAQQAELGVFVRLTLEEVRKSLGTKERDIAAAQREWEEHEKAEGQPRLPKPLLAIVKVDAAARSPEQRQELEAYFLRRVYPHTRLRFEALNRDDDRLRKAEDALLDVISSAMVMEEIPQPRTTRVLLRGDYLNEGEVVKPGVPASLPPLRPGMPANRLGLAQWLIDPGNPLTSRVAVNRLWQVHFGTGIVRTTDDFGSQGEAPSHPDLLDWLAVEFVAHEWDMKWLHRMIVTSATYRQASRVAPALAEKDPHNRLLARGPRQRLDAELVRDNALALCGLLDRRIGGPSVRPYQPAGLWDQVSLGGDYTSQTYVPSTGADLYRRSIYTYWKRSLPYPALVVFDAPNRELCTAQRARTTTPLQALVLLNDPTYVEAARLLAQRILRDGGTSSAARLRYAFRLCTARSPTRREVEILQHVLDRLLGEYRQDRQAAAKVIGVGESPCPQDLDLSELAAWTMIGSLLLNLDETISRG